MTNLRSILFGLLLVLTSARVDAALFGSEKKDFEAASKSFDTSMWSRAEKEFAGFIKAHPKSEKITDAVLFQAQALYGQQKYAEVISLLTSREGEAGKFADKFLYWTAEAQFESGDHRAAAATFGKLAREHSFSPLRLEAAVGEAASFVKLGEWAQVTNLLRKTDGAFRMAASAAKGSEMASRGLLVLGEAQLALKNYYDAGVVLSNAAAGATGELDWQRRLLLSRAYAENNQNQDADRESIGLMALAENLKKSELIAESVVFRASLLAKFGKSDEAIAMLRRNLTNAPAARQREALVRITTLAVANNRLDVATQALEQYLAETNTPAGDVVLAWLTLGELNLKQHVAQMNVAATNSDATTHFSVATNCFQRVITMYSESELVGKAQLNLGWCFWLEKQFAASASAFEAGAKRLPVSEDLVVAKFKLADALFALTNYSGALQNYQEALQLATNWPSVSAALSAPASYQALRASLELTNAAGAESAMRGILEADAAGGSADGAVLLVAQAYVDANQPVAAQRMFEEFVARFPKSQLRPEAELLVARMLEEQGDWTNAAAAYELWVAQFPTNVLRAQVEFQRALSMSRAGNEANALKMFTNFVAQFPANGLAARAQWWVADYFYQREDYAEAELNFKLVFQNWKSSELAYEARMMAGHAAVGKYTFDDAVEHFSNLTGDANCPNDLRMQAYFAYGGALMKSVPTATNKTEKLDSARSVFNAIVRANPTNELAALAWGEVGNCCLQLAAVAADASYFSAASNAYQMSFSIPSASVATRSQSKVGLAIVLEKQAQLAGNGGQAALLKEARELDLDVYFGKGLNGETPDAFWRKKAGSEAARLSELLGEWEQAIKVYRAMQREGLLPADALDKKIANAEKQLQTGNGKKN